MPKPNLSDYLGKKGHGVEKDAVGAPVKDIQWETQDTKTDLIPLIDPSVGKGVVLRSFFFKAVPLEKGFRPPTKDVILSHFKKLIETHLWKDGMSPLEHRVPRVYTRKELKKGVLKSKMIEENADFVIMVLCEARTGQMINDKHNILK